MKDRFISRGMHLGPILGFCLCFALLTSSIPANAGFDGSFSVRGAVKKPGQFTIKKLRKMPSFFLKDLYMIKEKKNCKAPDELLDINSYRGVLLRDLLLKAGLEHTRKWEPGVFIRVRGVDGREVAFSFGEIFYSSIGRSVLLAYEKNGRSLSFSKGCGELIVGTDVRAGRRIGEIAEISVARVDVKMHAYKDKKKHVVRPSTDHFTILDRKTGKSVEIKPGDLKQLPSIHIPAAVMAGECEGFRGVYSFDGPPLKLVLDAIGVRKCPADYSRFVLIASEDGFCATFSMGELFNSRLSDNIIIALEKRGAPLDPEHGFATSVVGEDSIGGRSVKRIHKIEIY